MVSDRSAEVDNLTNHQEVFADPNTAHDMNAVLKQVLNQLEESQFSDSPFTGIPTGFQDLDYKTLGMQPKDLLLVVSRPCMGKTTLLLNIAENVLLESNLKVILFSMGTPAVVIGRRMISSFGSVDHLSLRSGTLDESGWVRLTSALSQLQNKDLQIDDTCALTPQELRARVHRIAKINQEKVGAIVIDDADHLIIPGFEGTHSEKIIKITSCLKALAQELDCPVIASLKLSSRVEQRKNKRPNLSDFVESENADVVLFVYRDEVYKRKSKYPGVAEIIIGKQKNGPMGTVRLAFQEKYTRFTNLSPDIYRPEFEE